MAVMNVDNHLPTCETGVLLNHIFTNRMHTNEAPVDDALSLREIFESHFLIGKKLQFVFLEDGVVPWNALKIGRGRRLLLL